jgi:excisionase family DNA binding protein
MNGKQSSTTVREADIHLIDEPDSASLPSRNQVLTITEVARELRCSKAHIHNLINGKVTGVRPLPALWLGRRRLVRRSALEEWIAASERCYDPARPGFIAVGARKG